VGKVAYLGGVDGGVVIGPTAMGRSQWGRRGCAALLEREGVRGLFAGSRTPQYSRLRCANHFSVTSPPHVHPFYLPTTTITLSHFIFSFN